MSDNPEQKLNLTDLQTQGLLRLMTLYGQSFISPAADPEPLSWDPVFRTHRAIDLVATVTPEFAQGILQTLNVQPEADPIDQLSLLLRRKWLDQFMTESDP